MEMSPIKRHKTHSVQVGNITLGGTSPVVVQSMTNTDTADVDATVEQVAKLAQAGSELVRITVNSDEAAAAVPHIRDALLARDIEVPLVGDFHFNGHRLLTDHPACAEALAKYRINPGNVGSGQTKDESFSAMIEVALKNEKAVRIGVNWGSLDPQLVAHMMDSNAASKQPLSADAIMYEIVVTSAINSAVRAEQLGLGRDRLVLSCKMSGVQDLIAVYRRLAGRSDYALHLGLTEAGMGDTGVVASSAALGVLLQEGIGDTIRVSLTPEPGGSRTREVRVAQKILQSMGLRAFIPTVISCPGCGRTSSNYFQELAQEIQEYIRKIMPRWRQAYPGVESLKVAVMGCVVNGPGESKQADVGISLPGNGENPSAPVFIGGRKVATLKGENIAKEFKRLLNEYVVLNFGGKSE